MVAGPHDAVEELRAELEKAGVVSRLLQTSHAFHSSMMEPAVAPFEAELRTLKLSAPSTSIYSTVTGKRLTDQEACDPSYWASHLREPVRFSPALITALEGTPGLLLEVGPRATLTTLARQHGGQGRPFPATVQSLADAAERERETLLLAAGRLWTWALRYGSKPLIAAAASIASFSQPIHLNANVTGSMPNPYPPPPRRTKHAGRGN